MQCIEGLTGARKGIRAISATAHNHETKLGALARAYARASLKSHG